MSARPHARASSVGPWNELEKLMGGETTDADRFEHRVRGLVPEPCRTCRQQPPSAVARACARSARAVPSTPRSASLPRFHSRRYTARVPRSPSACSARHRPHCVRGVLDFRPSPRRPPRPGSRRRSRATGRSRAEDRVFGAATRLRLSPHHTERPRPVGSRTTRPWMTPSREGSRCPFRPRRAGRWRGSQQTIQRLHGLAGTISSTPADVPGRPGSVLRGAVARVEDTLMRLAGLRHHDQPPLVQCRDLGPVVQQQRPPRP